MSVIIDIDHETGDLSQYTSSVTDSGDLSVAAGAALAGTGYGLSALIDGTGGIYGTKDVTADTSGIVRYRFYIDPNALTMANNDSFTVCAIYNSSGQLLTYVNLNYLTASGFLINAFLVKDDASASASSAYAITDAPHYIEVKLIRATNDVSADGSVQLWIDGVDKQTVTGKDNYDRFANWSRARLGAITGLDAGTSGTFYLDELVVNDDGSEIGA